MRVVVVICIAAAALAAQNTPEKPSAGVARESGVIELRGGGKHEITTDVFTFVASEFGPESGPVKNAPYSAEAVTESRRTLADGTKIEHQNTAQTFRDGEGRTRREETLGGFGPWASREQHKTVVIQDPVAGTTYMLDPEKKTARKLPGFAGKAAAGGRGVFMAGEPAIAGAVRSRVASVPAAIGSHATFEMHHAGPMRTRSTGDLKEESLGKQVVEGVEAEGTRTSHVIAAGEIGNDRPLTIVTERWYSPELQTVVMSKTSDPLVGETSFKLTNIRRGEPGRFLFDVPPDYTVQEDHFKRKVEILEKTQ